MVSIPTGYDPTKPYPLGFAFHGFNLTEMLCFQGSQCGGFRAAVGDKAIVVVPKSLGPGWETPMYEANVKLVEDLLALVKAEYCVDESRVFMAGVSSGGQFLHRLGCRMGDQLWAASPIAAYLESAATMNCKGSPPQVIIHGISDMLDGGKKARDHYAMKYGCRAPAGLQMAEDKIKAALAAQRAEFACVDYEGCQSPLRWCMHSQIIYSGLTHGWPNVGGQLIADFLNTLK